MDQKMDALRQFLDKAHSVYHAAAALEDQLKTAGYARLQENKPWSLAPGGKYYLTRGGSAVLAFRIPEGAPGGFLISASHTDRPCFKVKENGILAGSYTRLAVERYGGMILAPWLDRPLSVAGRVAVETQSGVESRLVDFDRDLLLIPNVAIHLNKKINESYTWNPAVDMLPLLGGKDAGDRFWQELEALAGGKVLGHDLYLYVRQNTSVWGLEEEFFSAPAIDDLECAWACTQGFLNAKETANIPVLCVFDSEEVGSGSYQGAAADFMESTLARICRSLGLEESCQKAKSFLVSADNGHAIHPNHPELSDVSNAPVVNGGVVVKFNANQKYTTDGLSAAIFRKICQKAGVPVQTYCNRADLPGGSTLGNVSLRQVAVPSVDIGLAQLAMHSCYETAGVKDAAYLEQAMTAYYGTALELSGEGKYFLK
ncbi:MAG: M18 family aminopeptidase [Oscillospiraceae bacterium]|nr:M18 family aminopeptidase [Oscillospiraceae bacterium]